jgi:hypothetical protein
VAGVFLGSALWWLFLSTATGFLRERIASRLTLVNRLSGLTIGTFGLAALASLVFGF